MCEFEFTIYCPCIAKNNIINEWKRFVWNCNGDIKYTESGIVRKSLTFFIKVDDKHKKDIEYAYKQMVDYINGVDNDDNDHKSTSFKFFVWHNERDRAIKQWHIQLRKLGAIYKIKTINFLLFSIIIFRIYHISKQNYKWLELAQRLFIANKRTLF